VQEDVASWTVWPSWQGKGILVQGMLEAVQGISRSDQTEADAGSGKV